jgi:hypothetical protein
VSPVCHKLHAASVPRRELTWLARVAKDEVVANRPELVLVGLHFDDGMGRIGVGSEQSEAFASLRVARNSSAPRCHSVWEAHNTKGSLSWHAVSLMKALWHRSLTHSWSCRTKKRTYAFPQFRRLEHSAGYLRPDGPSKCNMVNLTA